MPKFFFITICWNNLSGLKTTIESLLMQSFQNWECIIIDGNSSDGTQDFIRDISGKYSNINALSEPDKGIYDAMNKGLAEMPACEYFCFLNSGDSLFSKDTLHELSHHLFIEKSKEPAIIYGSSCEVFESGKELVKPASRNIDLKKGMFCNHQCMFFAYRFAALRYDLSFKLSADYDYIVRAVKMIRRPEKVLHLNMVIARFDMTGASNSRRILGIMEDFKLRIKNGLCSEFSSAIYLCRSVGLMWLKRLSYPLYMKMRLAK